MVFSSRTYKIVAVLLCCCLAGLVIACRKIPKFSETPTIDYKNITKGTYFDGDQLVNIDTVVVGIHFKDGDGDIGYPVDQRDEDNLNFFVKVYRQTNGVFTPVNLAIPYDGHTPLLAPVNAPGPIEGEIYYRMNFTYSGLQAPDDTLKFEIKLKDRAGHVSNTIETEPIVIRQTP